MLCDTVGAHSHTCFYCRAVNANSNKISNAFIRNWDLLDMVSLNLTNSAVMSLSEVLEVLFSLLICQCHY